MKARIALRDRTYDENGKRVVFDNDRFQPRKADISGYVEDLYDALQGFKQILGESDQQFILNLKKKDLTAANVVGGIISAMSLLKDSEDNVIKYANRMVYARDNTDESKSVKSADEALTKFANDLDVLSKATRELADAPTNPDKYDAWYEAFKNVKEQVDVVYDEIKGNE